jgi:3-oxoadipate enol-lactonase
MVGDADTITPPSVSEAMKRLLPNARLTIVKGAWHATPMEQPSQVNRAIREHLLTLDEA